MITDPTRLRFGPYLAPSLKRGDRAFCLYRDADVVVTTWTAARIPWPRCRAVAHTAGGGVGLLVTDELKRAILSESAEALKHWFGVSTKPVWNWRKVFSASGRLGTPGSRAVLMEGNRIKGTLKRETTRTPAERRRRRRLAKRLNLDRYRRAARWAGREWTPEQLALLGTAPDAELAERFGRSANAVRLRRTNLGVPAHWGTGPPAPSRLESGQ